MNRLLLAAAATLSMAVSSHAMAATYTVDAFNDGFYFDSADTGAGGLVQNNDVIAPVSGIRRVADFSATLTDLNNAGPQAIAYFGDSDRPFLDIANDGGVSSSLTIHYDISSLASQVGPNMGVTFTVIAGPSWESGPTSITVLQNGAVLGTWSATVAIPGTVPGYSETSTFALLTALTGVDDDLAFYIDGPDGYDLTVTSIALTDVSPVPEPAEWAMMLAGIGVIGAAARRRSLRSSI